ncbi:MAG: NAD(P)H-binding protein [Nitrososphaeraceae archaeon]
MIDQTKKPSKKTILITGSTGFIGSRLLKRLLVTHKYNLKCISRKPEVIDEIIGISGDMIKVVKANALNYNELVNALKDVDIAFYLIHSMEGSSKHWKKFAELDKQAAINFANAATFCNVKRIIYLGGLVNAKSDQKISEHMQSRKEVGEILKKSSSKVTIFHAAVILGEGGGSFEILRYLVERLPIMICPKWVLTKSQPIAVDDVVTYLEKAIEIKETEDDEFDIGGPQILTYLDMMKIYSKLLNKSLSVIILPFLTTTLSSYWIDLITPIKASLARPLIESLRHEAVVKNDKINKIIPIPLTNFKNSVRIAKKEKVKKSKLLKDERTSLVLNNYILKISLILLSIVGISYYILDGRFEIFEQHWLILSGLWYIYIIIAFYFVQQKTRLGAILSGILGWITLTFWLFDNYYIIDGTSLIASQPSFEMTMRNFIGVGITILIIITSHNLFYKLRHYSI